MGSDLYMMRGSDGHPEGQHLRDEINKLRRERDHLLATSRNAGDAAKTVAGWPADAQAAFFNAWAEALRGKSGDKDGFPYGEETIKQLAEQLDDLAAQTVMELHHQTS